LIIDVFNHFYPKEYLDAIPKPLPDSISRVASTMKGITDLQYRLKFMNRHGVGTQVLSLPIPTIDDLSFSSDELKKIMRAANDGISKAAESSHGRFMGIATVSLLDVDAAVEELERAVNDLGLLGVQMLSNVRGKPLDSEEFEKFYEKAERLNCGIWIHPAYMRKTYDWMNDEYNLNMMMGWGIDTSLAMFRIFRGGVLERHPNLIIITHHMGTLIPLMAGRINTFVMGQGGEPSLKKSPMEYMKMFYVDTAEGMWKPALVLSQGFFGSRHMLFGTDFPWGDTGRIIENIRGLDIPDEEKDMILGGNAIRLLGMDYSG